MKLGNLVSSVGLTKHNLMEALKLGAGAAAFPFAYGLIQGQLLLKASSTTFAQNTPGEYVARGLLGIMGGALIGHKLLKMPSVGDGMVASAIGSIVKDLIAPLMNPAAAVVQNATTAAEAATGQSQQSANNPTGTGLQGFGAAMNPMLFGAGLRGATVAVQEPGMFSGATVQVEQPSAFAGSLT